MSTIETPTPEINESEFLENYEKVKLNPLDFSGWEKLIKIVEKEKDLKKVKLVYQEFLKYFPLCFGYWKKFAEFVHKNEDKQEAEIVWRKGLNSIKNSTDLWVAYLIFKLQTSENDQDTRSVFQEASLACGKDFLSHTFWDKYIQFEESRKEFGNLLKLLEVLIRIPLHQYVRYFEKYSAVSVTRPLSELLPEEELNKLTTDTKEQFKDLNKTENELEIEIRKKIHALKSEIYLQTQAKVHKIWFFEMEIKRNYFHVKALDESQLENWRKYLDFVVEENFSTEYVRGLYERCLVPCALYEEFWIKYAKYLCSIDDIEGAREVYNKACNTFIPKERPQIRLLFAHFEEEFGDLEKAGSIYQDVFKINNDHVETAVHFSYFKCRNGLVDEGLKILDDCFNTFSSKDGGGDTDMEQQDAEKKNGEKEFHNEKGILLCHKAKIFINFKKDDINGRKIFKEGIETYYKSKFLIFNFLMWECGSTVDDFENLLNAWNFIHDLEKRLNEKQQKLHEEKQASNFSVKHSVAKNISLIPIEKKVEYGFLIKKILFEKGFDFKKFKKFETEFEKFLKINKSDLSVLKRKNEGEGIASVTAGGAIPVDGRPFKMMKVDQPIFPPQPQPPIIQQPPYIQQRPPPIAHAPYNYYAPPHPQVFIVFILHFIKNFLLFLRFLMLIQIIITELLAIKFNWDIY
ncbi:hypothetical protein HK099_004448 [Clydaea vesicula]|uniref:Uncharacterized protein n=1 Tax=Clydaea vesicula TaxID=447962 RepID=A0AAD5U374_9FUNG|nr:hypothetical protein HK099_004448 [Clydaea vesicula]